MSNSGKILVVGGTGLVGSIVVKLLLDAGKPVSILVRNNPDSLANAQPLVSAGASIVIGDLTDPASLKDVTEGITSLICTAAVLDHSFTAGYQALMLSALETGVAHVVYLSNIPRIEPMLEMFSAKVAIEEVIQRSGIAYTILKSEPFLGYMVKYLIQMPLEYSYPVGIYAQNEAQGKRGSHFWIVEEDVARLLVAIVGNPQAFYHTFHAGGKLSLTFSQLIERYAQLNELEISTQLYTEPPMGVPLAVYKIIEQLFCYESEKPDPVDELFNVTLTHPHRVLRNRS